jgi:hypothetical protein
LAVGTLVGDALLHLFPHVSHIAIMFSWRRFFGFCSYHPLFWSVNIWFNSWDNYGSCMNQQCWPVRENIDDFEIQRILSINNTEEATLHMTTQLYKWLILTPTTCGCCTTAEIFPARNTVELTMLVTKLLDSPQCLNEMLRINWIQDNNF